jgi:hypothetical protein
MDRVESFIASPPAKSGLRLKAWVAPSRGRLGSWRYREDRFALLPFLSYFRAAKGGKCATRVASRRTGCAPKPSSLRAKTAFTARGRALTAPDAGKVAVPLGYALEFIERNLAARGYMLPTG